MGYVWAWIRNIISDLLVVGGVCLLIYVFMRIFYPDMLGIMMLSGQTAIGLINILKLWPLVVLAVIVYALPRRWHRR